MFDMNNIKIQKKIINEGILSRGKFKSNPSKKYKNSDLSLASLLSLNERNNNVNTENDNNVKFTK